MPALSRSPPSSHSPQRCKYSASTMRILKRKKTTKKPNYTTPLTKNPPNCCYFCNKHTCMHRTDICSVLVWMVPEKLSLQLLSNSNVRAPTPAPPRPCTVLNSGTRGDSQHSKGHGFAPYALINKPHCVTCHSAHTGCCLPNWKGFSLSGDSGHF